MVSVGFDDKYLPGNSTDNKDGKAGKLRLLQYKSKTCKAYNVSYGKLTPVSTPTSVSKTIYPYMGHLDDPLASTSDINFGMPRYIGLPGGTPVTNNNAFNAYWSKYLQEVVDKDSKIVKGKFYLTPADMEKLSFRDLYFFDGNYFRLNKVEDYDPVNPSVNICEFLFLKSGVNFSATTGTVGGGGKRQDVFSGLEEYDPYDGVNLPGRVIQDKGISIGQYNDAGSGVLVGNRFTNYGERNAAFASSGVTFLGNDSIVIGETPSQPIANNEVWLQGHLMMQNNFSTNRIVAVSESYNAGLYDDILICSSTADATISLPPAASAVGKAYYIFKKTSAHKITINPYESELIDFQSDYKLTNEHECVQIVCDGVVWYVISKK